MKRRTDGEGGRQIQQLAEPKVPSDQPSVAVEYAQTLPDIFERALKQRVLALQPPLAALQMRGGELLALQSAESAPSKGCRSHGEHHKCDDQRGKLPVPYKSARSVGEEERRAEPN